MNRSFKTNSAAEVFFQLVSDEDASTAVTGATPTITAIKTGEISYSAIAGTCSEISDGTYKITLAANDTDTVGGMMLQISATDALTQFLPITITASDIDEITDMLETSHLTLASSEELVTLGDLKNHLRIELDNTDEDSALSIYIRAAVACVRQASNVEISSKRTYSQQYSGFPNSTKSDYFWNNGLLIPISPVDEITSITYISSGTVLTLSEDEYTVDYGYPTVIYSTDSFPSADTDVALPITVTFTCGQDLDDPYNDTSAIARQAVLLLASHWYKNRETSVIGVAAGELPYSAKALIDLIRRPIYV